MNTFQFERGHNKDSQLTGCFSLESGVIVFDLKSKRFLEDTPYSNFTEHFENAFVFSDFESALNAGRKFCGEAGFKVLCFGEAIKTKPINTIVGSVLFD